MGGRRNKAKNKRKVTPLTYSSNSKQTHICKSVHHGLGDCNKSQDPNFIKEDKERDRISQLPQDVMCLILSSLGMKYGAQTSTLSKGWRYLWPACCTHLDFSDAPKQLSGWNKCTRIEQRNRYLTWVDQVVESVNKAGPCCIDAFKVVCIFCLLLPSDSRHIDRWIACALKKRVKELTLNLGIPIGDPVYTLGFDKLKKHPTWDVGISFLRSLSLSYIDVSGDFLEFLLSRCCLLEKLYVDNSTILVSFKVTSPKLQHLSVTLCDSLEQLEIVDAINLTKFELCNRSRAVDLALKSVPSLVEASFWGICGESLSSIAPQISGIKKLFLDVHIMTVWNLKCSGRGDVSFPNVKHLELTVECYPCNNLICLRHFVAACPLLCSLKFKLSSRDDNLGEEATELREADGQLESEGQRDLVGVLKLNKDTHSALKVVELDGFMGCRVDVRLALYIVNYATSLERIICSPLRDAKATEMDILRSRARKFAKLVEHKVKVTIL